MKITRTIITVFTLMFAISACAGNQKNKNQETRKENKNMTIIHLTKAEFLKKVWNFEANGKDWKYEGDKPCIVDFFATWCGPCRQLSPILEELAKEYDGKLYIYKIDVDKESDLAGAFGVRSIPMMLFVPMTGQPTMSQGLIPKAEIKKFIDEKMLK